MQEKNHPYNIEPLLQIGKTRKLVKTIGTSTLGTTVRVFVEVIRIPDEELFSETTVGRSASYFV